LDLKPLSIIANKPETIPPFAIHIPTPAIVAAIEYEANALLIAEDDAGDC
jgi:hypothetical protein